MKPEQSSEESLLRELEELRQELYRVTGGSTVELDGGGRESAEEISARLDRLVVEVVKRRRARRKPG
ncbi:MAG: hypothetical protein AB1816_14270 [Bacillota bacterium]